MIKEEIICQDRDKILESFWPRLSRISASYEKAPQLQHDLAQEMALAIWQSLNSFRGDSSVETFCYRIAHNVAVGHIKKQVKQLDTVDDDVDLPTSRTLEQGAYQDQKLTMLMHAIRQLPIIQRQIITLYLDGVKQQDIAQILGMSENNIAVTINRAKQSLAQKMSHD